MKPENTTWREYFESLARDQLGADEVEGALSEFDEHIEAGLTDQEAFETTLNEFEMEEPEEE